MATLAVAHQLGGGGGLAPQGAAQLADDAADVRVQMDVLAHERCTPAVGAAVATRLEHVDGTTQQTSLESLAVAVGRPAHAQEFAIAVGAPA